MGSSTARTVCTLPAALVLTMAAIVAQPGQTLPTANLRYGAFTMKFAADGVFTLNGQGWPPFSGTWTIEGETLTLTTTGGPPACSAPGRYRVVRQGAEVRLAGIADDCVPRRMILHGSSWRPEGGQAAKAERHLSRSGPDRPQALPESPSAKGSWPSFRGANASGIADGENLPETWSAKTRQNILWQTPIPGLAHSSPVIWGDRIFVATAISSRGGATFKPGLYGDGDASEDTSPHKWVLYAIDKRTGKIVWDRTAFDGAPRNKRHIKSTYASASPATDGRVVVAWFG
jgi:hypothetical protein